MTLKWLVRAALTVAGMIAAGGPVLACSRPVAFDLIWLDRADIIFQGTVDAYEAMPGGNAKITFKVTKHIRGDGQRASWAAFWNKSRNMDYRDFATLKGQVFIVGLEPAEDAIEHRTQRIIDPDGTVEILPLYDPHNITRDMPWIVRDTCAPPFIFAVQNHRLTWMAFDDQPKGQKDDVEKALQEHGMLE